MVTTCIVPECRSGYKSCKTKSSHFKVPTNLEMLKKWEDAIPGGIKLKSSNCVCEKHFEEKYIIRKYIKYDAKGKIIAEAFFERPRLNYAAVPTLYGDKINENVATREKEYSKFECQSSEVSINDDSDTMETEQELYTTESTSTIAITAVTGNYPFCDGDFEPKAMPETSSEKKINSLPVIIAKSSDQEASHIDEWRRDFSSMLPKSWSFGRLSKGGVESLLFSYARLIKKDGVDSPIIQKCVILQSDKVLRYHVYGHPLKAAESNLVETLNDIEELPKILNYFDRLNLCYGIGTVNMYNLQLNKVYQDYFQEWHHNDCTLISKSKRCKNCFKYRKVATQKESRLKKNCEFYHISNSPKSTDKSKLMAIQKKNKRLAQNRTKARVTLLRQLLQDKKEEIAIISAQSLEKKCCALNVPEAQKIALQEIIDAASKTDARGRRYADDWIMLCMMMNIKSPTYYEFLRNNQILPLPCRQTIREYFSLMSTKSGFDENFSELLKKYFARKSTS